LKGPGQRVFSLNASVTDGRLEIMFTPQIENPEINAIEIIPQP
jgi:hypothetical protein